MSERCGSGSGGGGLPLRKIGKCESKLRVLSCQAAIRQRRGRNELSVCVLFRDRLRVHTSGPSV